MRSRIVPAVLVLVVAGAIVLFFAHHSTPPTSTTTTSPPTSIHATTSSPTTVRSTTTTSPAVTTTTAVANSPAAVQARDEAAFTAACNQALAPARIIITGMRAGIVPSAAKLHQLSSSITNATSACPTSEYVTFVTKEYGTLSK
jgi:hypothetical protein